MKTIRTFSMVIALLVVMTACDNTAGTNPGSQPTGPIGHVKNPKEPVKLADDTVLTSGGNSHTLILRGDGSLWARGDNTHGQIGDGTRESTLAGDWAEEPFLMDEVWHTIERNFEKKVLDDVEFVSAGHRHNMLIQTDGSLWGWGWNFYGQIGNGDEYNYDAKAPALILDYVASVSAGLQHTAAVKKDGSLWVWGSYIGSSPKKMMDDAAMASVGWRHMVAVKTDGSLWGWGENSVGQLGSDNREEILEFIPLMDDVVFAAAGNGVTAAIQSDGSLWVWGWNNFGQLACCNESGSDALHEQSPVPRKIMEDVSHVALGEAHLLALKTDGSLWSWGRNWDGQLGYEADEYSHTPTLIMEDVVFAEAGENHSLAIKTDGSIWGWGRASSGQLGDLSVAWSEQPVQE